MYYTDRANNAGDGGLWNISTSDNNPVFTIKLKSLATTNEQPAVSKNTLNYERFPFKVGDYISGIELNGKKQYKGYVSKIDFENKTYIEIKDEKTNKHIDLDFSTCKLLNGEDDTNVNNELPFIVENKKNSYIVKKFKDF